MFKISFHSKPALFRALLASSVAISLMCVGQNASATDLDAVMARLEKLEADNKKIVFENESLKERLHRLEGGREKKPLVTSQFLKKLRHEKEIIQPYVTSANISAINMDTKSKWNGFYGGLNAGYGWGTNTSASSKAIPLYDNGALPVTLNEANNYYVNNFYGASALANTANFGVNQSGLIGGLQAGYNYEIFNQTIIGGEADIQGSSIVGDGSYTRASPNELINEYNDCCLPTHYYNSINYTHYGSGNINAGINWFGTLRGRLGYEPTPEILIFGTAGLAYGNVYANSANSFIYNATVSVDGQLASYVTYPWLINSLGGSGKYSANKIGWAAGAGAEWMFTSNWSLKGEVLYYNLGTASFSGSPIISSETYYRQTSGAQLLKDINAQQSRVAFGGIIARAGVNYHFSTEGGTTVIKY